MRTGCRAFVAFDLLCKLISLAFFLPLSAWILGAVLHWSGDQVVSNFDLISFFFSLQGLLLVVAWATGGFAVLFFELGGLALLAVGVQRGESVSAVRTLQFLSGRLPHLLALGLRQFLLLGAMVAVVAAVAAATKATLLGGGDIYFYLQVQPPEYWWAVTIVGTAATAAGISIIALLFRWIFAVPVLLLEGTNARTAMVESCLLVQQVGARQIVMRLAGWGAVMILLLILGGFVHDLLGRALMAVAGGRVNLVIAMAGLLLAIDFLLAIALGLIAAISFASVVARIYTDMRTDLQLPKSLVSKVDVERGRRHFPIAVAVVGGTVALASMAVVLSYSIISQIRLDENIAVTAHRGSSVSTPENTMAAILRAIEDGADYAEIDVQETADGVIVLLHDTDLRRVAGVDKGIWELTYDDLKRLDIGSWFSEEFAEERIVTLGQAMEATRGRMKLNIELKFNGHNQRLEAEVARLVKQARFENECIVTSLEFAAMQEIARQDGRLRRGLILTAKVGDATTLNVDLLAVNAQSVTRDLVTRAHQAGQEVHVWTVNDPQQMLTMIHMGVDNILTSSPDILVDLLREREKLTDAERTLLFVSDFLAGRL